MQIVLKGQVPAQKNRKVISVNSRTKRPFLRTHEAVKEWQDDVSLQLMQYKGTASKATITYKFYCKDKRRRDLDNMIASVNDALVKAGLLEDDSWQCLSIGAAEGAYDKDDPRVELYIDED